MSGVEGVCAATPRPPWSCAAAGEGSLSPQEAPRAEGGEVQVRRPRTGGGAAGASPVPGGDCRPHPLQEWGKAKGAGAGGLQGPRPSSANQQRPAASWRASGVGGEADGRVSVAPQPRRRQGGLGGVPLLPAPEDTALPHPPVGQCRPGHPLSPSAAGGATLPVDPPPLCSTVTPQATPSSWLQQSLSAQSSPHAGPHPEPSPVSLAPLDTPVPQNKSSSLGLTRPCPHGWRWRPSSERPSASGRSALGTPCSPTTLVLPPPWDPPLRVGHSSAPHWGSASPGVHKARALPWSPRWLAACCPQERCPPSTAGTTPACPAPSLTTLSPRAQECLPGFWSCGCPPAPTQPLVSPWLVPGLPGQARNRRVGPGSLHSWLHDQERSGNERQPEWDGQTDRQAEAERGGRVETPR